MEKNNFMSKFASVMMPISQAISSNRYVRAISAGMMLTIPLTMIGAFGMLLGSAPGEAAQAMSGFAGSFFRGWANFAANYGSIFVMLYNCTLGILALVVAAGVAYSLAGEYGLGKIQCAVVSIAVFLFSIGFSTTYFGGLGIFTALLVAIVTVEIARFCKTHDWTVKMPDEVPDTIANSFTALIPFALSVLVFGLALFVVQRKDPTLNLGSWFIGFLRPAINTIDSYPVVLLMTLFGTLLWSFGIHGHAVIMPLFNPIIASAMAENFELVAAGSKAVFHPVFLVAVTNVAAFSMWILAPMMIRSKSKTLNAIGKATIVPGLFVMEPVFFGTPIALNFILMIPYILLNFVNFFVFLILYKTGVLPVPYIYVGGITPLGLGYFLQTQNAIGFLIPWIQVLISIPVWIPFFKIYEKQILAEEEAE